MNSNGGYHSQTIIDADHFDAIMGEVIERLGAVEEKQLTAAELQHAFTAVMRAALTDQALIEDVMGKVVSTAQRRAAEKTGNAVGGVSY